MAKSKSVVDYLSDIEKQKISAFIKDKVMSEAVRKVLLAGIYYNGTLVKDEPANPAHNFALQLGFQSDVQGVVLSDEQIGADVRAQVKGIRLLEGGFLELSNCVPAKELPDKPTTPNKGY